MYGPKEVKELLDAFLKGVDQEYSRFLDERRKEWAQSVHRGFRKIPVGENLGDLDKASIRLRLMRDIWERIDLQCRRDARIPRFQFEETESLIQKLQGMRDEMGLGPHPTILSAYATLLMQDRQYGMAEQKLRESISLNEGRGGQWLRDQVTSYWNLSRIAYETGRCDMAIELADTALKLSTCVDRVLELSDYLSDSGHPDPKYFCPSLATGYTAACDARVHHPGWNDSIVLQEEFTGLWSDGQVACNIPNCWSPQVKIALVSDRVWCMRVRSYVVDIAGLLYVETGSSWYEKQLRVLRSQWGGFRVDFGRLDTAACLGLFIVLVGAVVEKPIDHRAGDWLPKEKVVLATFEAAGVPFDEHKFLATAMHYLGKNLEIGATDFSTEFEVAASDGSVRDLNHSGSLITIAVNDKSIRNL